MGRRATIRNLRAALALTGLLAAAGVGATEIAPAVDVHVRDGRVSVKVASVPLRAVVEAVASLHGASVTGLQGDATLVTANFTDLPLPEALNQLLQGRSYLLVQASGSQSGQLRRIAVVNGTPSDGRISPTAVAKTTVAPPATADVVDGGLAEALQVLAVALDQDDPMLRVQLLERVAAWKLDDPSRRILLARLSADPNPEIREVVLDVIHADQDPEARRAALASMEPRRHSKKTMRHGAV